VSPDGAGPAGGLDTGASPAPDAGATAGGVAAGPARHGPGGDLEAGAEDGRSVARRHYRQRRRRRRGLLIALVVVVLIVLAGAGALWWARGEVSGDARRGAVVTVTVPDGLSSSKMAALLARSRVVREAWLFRLYTRVKGVGPWRAGDYRLHQNEGYGSVVSDLDAGPLIHQIKLTIPEGFTAAQIADRVGQDVPGRSAATFLQATKDGSVRSRFEPAGVSTLEGLLFPDTYFFRADESEQAMVQRLVSGFDQAATPLGLDTPDPSLKLTPYQVVTVASMIEREAKVPEDRAKIARVIYNRLAKGMKLQIDATVLYALGGHKTGVTDADLTVDSLYNTYKVAGLPPGPIANPGRDSIVAALHPAPGPWLWYVLAGSDGHHAFDSTEKQFEADKAAAHAKGLL
jgi:UPF0755 protein